MYYNCGIAIAKRQTKLKLHFIIKCDKTDYCFPWFIPFSQTFPRPPYNPPTFPGFPGEWSPCFFSSSLTERHSAGSENQTKCSAKTQHRHARLTGVWIIISHWSPSCRWPPGSFSSSHAALHQQLNWQFSVSQ